MSVFYVKSKRTGKWKPFKEVWEGDKEVGRAKFESKGYTIGTMIEKDGERGVVSNDKVEKAMGKGYNIYDHSGQREKFLTDDSHKYRNEKESALEAGLENFADGVMFGQLPRLKAFAAKLIGGKDYGKALAQYRAEKDQREEDHATVAAVTDIAGSVLSPNIVGKVGMAANGLKGLNNLAKAKGVLPSLVKGGIDTAVRASGRTDDSGEISGNVALGGLLSAGGGLLGRSAGALGDLAAERAVKALGLTKGQLKKMGIERARELGRYALDNKIVKAFKGADEMAEQVSQRSEVVGKGLDEVYDVLEKTGVKFKPEAVIEYLQQHADLDPKVLKQKLKKSGGALFNDLADDIVDGGNVGAKRARELKQMIADHLPRNAFNDDTVKEKTAKAAYGKLADIPTKIAEYVKDDGIQDNLSGLNSEYSKLADTAKLLKDKVSSEVGNRMLKLTDQMYLASAVQEAAKSRFSLDSIKTLILSMGIKKAGDLFGNQTMAVLADKASKNVPLRNRVATGLNMFQRSVPALTDRAKDDDRRASARQRHLQD